MRFESSSRSSRRSISKWHLVFLCLGLPLLFYGLYWTAVNFPMVGYQMAPTASVTRESDSRLRIHHTFPNEILKAKSYVDHEYVLNLDSGSLTKVRKNFRSMYQHSPYTAKVCSEVPGSSSFVATITFRDLDYLSERLRLSSKPTLTASQDMIVLLDSKQSELARWTVVAGQPIRASQGMIATEDLNGNEIVVRNATTGDIQANIPLNLPPTGPAFNWLVHDSVVTITSTGNLIRCYELQTGRELPTVGSWENAVLDIAGDEFLTMKEFNFTAPIEFLLQLREIPTGRIIREYPMPLVSRVSNPADDSIRFSRTKNEILVTGIGEEVYVIDKLTGATLNTIEPRKYDFALSIFAILFACVWCLYWFWISNKLGFSRLLRSGVLIFLLISFVLLRINLSGHHANYVRMAWQSVWSLFAVGRWLLVVYVSQRELRILKRFEMPFLFGIFLNLATINWEYESSEQSRMLQAMICYGVLYVLVLCFYPIKKLSKSSNDFAVFSMADALKWLTISGVLAFAISRNYLISLTGMDLNRFWGTAAEAAVLTMVGAAAWFIVLRVGNTWYAKVATLTALLLVIAVLTVGWVFYFDSTNWLDTTSALVTAWPALTVVGYVAIFTWPTNSEESQQASAAA